MVDAIKIGGFLYDVKQKTMLNSNTHQLGEIDYHALEILIKRGVPNVRKHETILHEALHGICDIYGVKLSENNVNVLSSAIYAFIIDNPRFFKEIEEEGGDTPTLWMRLNDPDVIVNDKEEQDG